MDANSYQRNFDYELIVAYQLNISFVIQKYTS